MENNAELMIFSPVKSSSTLFSENRDKSANLFCRASAEVHGSELLGILRSGAQAHSIAWILPGFISIPGYDSGNPKSLPGGGPKMHFLELNFNRILLR